MLLAQISSWTDPLTQVIADDIGRIAWNTFLALVPQQNNRDRGL